VGTGFQPVRQLYQLLTGKMPVATDASSLPAGLEARPTPEAKNENGPAIRIGRASVLYSLIRVNQSRGRTAPVKPL
jgi:hypothetical protein